MAAGDPIPWSYIATRVAETELTSDSSIWDDSPELSVGTVSATLVSGERYIIWAQGRVSGGTAGGTAGIRIREDSGISGTQLQFANVYIGSTTGNGFSFYLYADYTAAATASKTFSLTGQSTGGVHNQQIRAAANAPTFLVIDRLVAQ